MQKPVSFEMAAARIAVVGDWDAAKRAHQGIEASIALYQRDVDSHLEHVWIRTSSISAESRELFRDVTGIWCAPGSPYENMPGALLAISHARTRQTPFLGTCGGFQHALLEFAQNVMGLEARHEELDPSANRPLITKLGCSLIGARGKVHASSEGFARLLGCDSSVEEFNCNYGLNSDLAALFEGSDLAFVAHDELGQPRAFRLNAHPFFVGTLFQPERRALAGSLHPLVLAFLTAAMDDARLRPD